MREEQIEWLQTGLIWAAEQKKTQYFPAFRWQRFFINQTMKSYHRDNKEANSVEFLLKCGITKSWFRLNPRLTRSMFGASLVSYNLSCSALWFLSCSGNIARIEYQQMICQKLYLCVYNHSRELCFWLKFWNVCRANLFGLKRSRHCDEGC